VRIVVAGKGGVGKTTITGALCTALAERGVEVIAVDADGSPNLSLTLGAGNPEDLPAVANRVPASSSDACDMEPLTASEIVAGFSVQAFAHVSLVQTGRIERPSHRCLCCGSHTTAREVIAALPNHEHEVVVGGSGARHQRSPLGQSATGGRAGDSH
jgi:CO dehydrogenase maturation factor